MAGPKLKTMQLTEILAFSEKALQNPFRPRQRNELLDLADELLRNGGSYLAGVREAPATAVRLDGVDPRIEKIMTDAFRQIFEMEREERGQRVPALDVMSEMDSSPREGHILSLLLGLAAYQIAFSAEIGPDALLASLNPLPWRKWCKEREWDVVGTIERARICYGALTGRLKGESAPIRRVREKTWAACFGSNLILGVVYQNTLRRQNVMIRGETGTGKEIVGTILRECSGAGGTGEAINIAAIPETLVDSELFGYMSESFTGAPKRDFSGAIVRADKGTLFVDEAGDIPMYAQAKLLRVMETGEVPVIGKGSPTKVDVKYVGATHRKISESSSESFFRQDLWFRFSGYTIEMPSLKELHDNDIREIVRVFMKDRKKGFSDLAKDHEEATIEEIIARHSRKYTWPGNVRELRNTVYEILLQGLDEYAPVSIHTSLDISLATLVPEELTDGSWSADQVKSWYAKMILAKCKGKKVAASERLRMGRNTLNKWLKYKGVG